MGDQPVDAGRLIYQQGDATAYIRGPVDDRFWLDRLEGGYGTTSEIDNVTAHEFFSMADHIEQLNARVEKLERLREQTDTTLFDEVAGASPWIPVTKRLPDEEGRYLTTRNGNHDAPKVRLWTDNSFGYNNVTHWMPIPELPTEGDNDNFQSP